jgi:hypothetical protein
MCGARVPLNVSFCSYCGAALSKPDQQSKFSGPSLNRGDSGK